MLQLKKYRQRLTLFISSDKGQQFFNFAYSIGAAIVIWGALFQILHIRGGNILLAIGMGTEVVMFVLTAFDRPPRQGYDSPAPETPAATDTPTPAATDTPTPARLTQPGPAPAAHCTVADYAGQMAAVTEQLQQLGQTTAMLNKVSATLLSAYDAITAQSDDINDASNGFAAQMHALNQNIRGLNTIYEIQLKNVSSQLDSIDRVNQGIKDMRDMYEKCAGLSAKYCEEAEKMAHNMAQLNRVYENMVTAMTVNMNMGAQTNGI